MELEFVIGLLLLVCASAAKDSVEKTGEIENYSEIMKYVGNLEREMHGMKNHIRKMEKFGGEQAAKIRKLESQIKNQDSKTERKSNKIEELRHEVAYLKVKIDSSDNIPLPVHNYSELYDNADSNRKVKTSKVRRYLLADVGDIHFGFSAYLDHSVSNLGINQTIIFNTNLFNDAGAYNNTTGIYTCPVSGVYLFFFAVGSGAQHQIVAKLVTNGVNQVGAIADSEYHASHEGHASNMVILRLAAGTHVSVENYRWNHQYNFAEGGKTDRFTTFSGVLLYQ